MAIKALKECYNRFLKDANYVKYGFLNFYDKDFGFDWFFQFVTVWCDILT